MKIAVLKERSRNEKRVAVVPETVAKYKKLGIDVCVEAGAGMLANYTDEEYIQNGAKVSKIPLEIIGDADILLKVQPSPISKNKDELTELSFIKDHAIVIGLLSPYSNHDLFRQYNDKKISAIAMELIPRITRAQPMDVLSSQSNLVGYKAVIDACYEFDRIFPMMMTAAGTITPAKVLILGAGVAGLQAVATAKRLGAVVSVFDVRKETKEQVESLGGKFVEVSSNEDGGTNTGYAKEMSEEYKQKQAKLILETISKHDIVITTALIPGKRAPILVTKEMVDAMRPGSLIVDIAAVTGGNCELTEPNEIIIHNGVKIIGYENYPSRVAASASRLYSNNLFNLVSLMVKNDKNLINLEDEIIQKSLITHQGITTNAISN